MWGWIAGTAVALCLQDPEPDVKALFVANCASCHGETGDGQGWTRLDRPARSFQDGGFSYGNTPEALFRTITVGIPGTPMPGFGTSLTEAQRRLLAGHVVTLGPEGVVVEPEDTVMVVRDRPLIVRGHLPPITEGAKAVPRGLLIGTTDGLTFEYRVDDVSFLGVRQGGFVERTDWVGRGGTPLKPLGQVVYVAPEQGRVVPPARMRGELTGTWVRGSEAGLAYLLKDAEDLVVARVAESVRAETATAATGFRRSFVIRGEAGGEIALGRGFLSGFRAGESQWTVARREDGSFELTGMRYTGGAITDRAGTRYTALVTEPGSESTLELTTLIAPEWSDEIQARFVEELGAR